MSSWLSLLPEEEIASFERACSNRPSRAIRLRDDRSVESLPFSVKPVAWNGSGFWLVDQEIRPASYVEYGAGAYYIQDAGSLLPISLLAPKPGEWICDLCAAPGGKASAILEQLGGSGVLVANEAIRNRVDSLRTVLARTGMPNYIVANHDPDALADRLQGRLDAVLVDAPCSGQMLVGRDKHDDKAWSDDEVSHCAKRQNRILDAAIRLLKPGGRLVYSTCTFAVEENELQLQRIVEQDSAGWSFGSVDSLGMWKSPLQAGCYRLWPHRDRCAGGFAGVIHRSADSEVMDRDEERVPGGRSKARRKKVSSSAQGLRAHPKDEKSAVDALQEFGILGEESRLRLWGRDVVFGTDDVWQLLDTASSTGFPPTALYKKGSRWLPSHPLSLLRSRWFTPNRSIELSEESSREYLAGGALPMLDSQVSEHANGWHVARWQGAPLGWCKNAGNRWNNHLPSWATLRP